MNPIPNDGPIDLSSYSTEDLRALILTVDGKGAYYKAVVLEELLGRAAKKALRFTDHFLATDPEENRLRKAVQEAGIDGGILTSDAIEELNLYLARRAELTKPQSPKPFSYHQLGGWGMGKSVKGSRILFQVTIRTSIEDWEEFVLARNRAELDQ